ncbi:MAG: CtsR family transcriptional regulator [Christensenellales bacterium]
MAAISDTIEQFIRELFDGESQQVEIQRNELAQLFRCAPSQINYVLATRFTLDQGYVIQSRRGGGGYIRIIRMDLDGENNLLDRILQKIGDVINERRATHIIETMYDEDLVDERTYRTMLVAIADRTLAPAGEARDVVRANLMKVFILTVTEK